MDDKIYFQWQNEFLLKTIYPLRERKLIDFLVYYKEIDVWAEYEGRTDANLGEEFKAYRIAQEQVWIDAYNSFDALSKYFLTEDVTLAYKQEFGELDPGFMEKINALHKTFATYFPKVKSIANQRYFISQRTLEWEQRQKGLQGQIAKNQRNLRNMPPTWGRREEVIAETKMIETITLKMAAVELFKLYDFLAAFTKLEKRRMSVKKKGDQTGREKSELTSKLNAIRAKAKPEEAKQSGIVAEINRLKSPPDLAALETYFKRSDIAADYQAKFPQPDPVVLAQITKAHQAVLNTLKVNLDPNGRAAAVKIQIGELGKFRKASLDPEIARLTANLRNMPPNWSHRAENEAKLKRLNEVSLGMLNVELRKMDDFAWALLNGRKTKPELDQMIKQKESERGAIQQKLTAITAEAAPFEERLKTIDSFLNLSEKEQVLKLGAFLEVTKEDLARGKVDVYKADLAGKNHQELLEIVVARFLANPKRYPLWLQYMVIHFSGMRYKSAHGSWADPKDLLLSLRTKNIVDDLRKADDDAIEALCLQEIASYEAPQGMLSQPVEGGEVKYEIPLLAKTADPAWRNKVEHHLNEMKSTSPTRQRKALIDLRTDEEVYEVGLKNDDEALEGLELLRKELPSWMWKEIERLTDLRLKTKDENWEIDSADDIEARYDYRWRHYREILVNWKKEHLTGWREEHDRSNRLIVTRAVCNEVAEHIQHLRGHTPPGGLTAKPEWYLRKEKDPKLSALPDHPYFKKPALLGDFKRGASILWLRFVHDQPNPWRIAYPLTLKNGDGLLPAKLESRKGWRYFTEGRNIMRSGKALDAKGNSINVTEYLRWMHEATVAETAMTADGPTVLTFETALPYEDKRQSTIGVFKHSLSELRYFVTGDTLIGSFVGYIPEGVLPASDLKDMLDWNHVLRREALSEAEQAAYWAKVLPQPGSSAVTASATTMEAAPPLLPQNTHQESIQAYVVDQTLKFSAVYQPEVSLKRGSAISVLKTGKVFLDASRSFYPVLECSAEPRFQELYVRAGDVQEVDEKRKSLPVAAKVPLTLSLLQGKDPAGKPILKALPETLPAGTKFRVSGGHKLTPLDKGDGAVKADGVNAYYLIVDCPGRSSANGCFVRLDQTNALTEEKYGDGDPQAPEELRVRSCPAENVPALPIFRDAPAGMVKSTSGESIPKETEFKVDPEPIFRKGETYYRVREYTVKPAFVGTFIRVKDVELIL